MMRKLFSCGAIAISVTLSGCGTYVPEKYPLLDSSQKLANNASPAGNFEDKVAAHVKCEIEKGLLRVADNKKVARWVPWLFETRPVEVEEDDLSQSDPRKKKKVPKPFGWGTSVSIQLQVEDQTQLNPGIGVVEPLHNAYGVVAGPSSYPFTPAALATPTISAIPQSFNIGIGVTANSHATRQETMQFTWDNAKLLAKAIKVRDEQRATFGNSGEYSCRDVKLSMVSIDSDLKIADFIYDKAVAAASTDLQDTKEDWPPFNTFQEVITFTAAFGVGVTPTWKFTRVTWNPNTQTAAAQRNEINTIIITLGPEDPKNPANPVTPLSLATAAANQHNAASQAALISTATRAITP